jgi:nitroreductase
MKFLELAEQRYSLRHYAAAPVPREAAVRCVAAARLAPSACNAQPWHFVLVDEAEKIGELGAAATTPGLPINSFVRKAPMIAVLVTEKPTITSRIGAYLKDIPFHFMDTGIAAEHFCLQAAEEGLGSCMIGWFDAKRVKRLLGVPEKKSIALLITLGYPEREGIPEKTRKPLEEMLSWNGYGQER